MHQLSASRRIKFSDLAIQVRGSGAETYRFSSCCSSYRECQEGDLFIAITGPDSDGHDDVEEAVKRGARAILAERYLPAQVPVFLTDDTREAYGHICHALAQYPSRDLHSVGIAGTSGKTSVSRLLTAILKGAGRLTTAATDERWFEPQTQANSASITTPRIVAGLSDASACGFRHSVLELHSAHLARRVWAGTELDTIVLTNATSDFRGIHNSAENHRRAILRSLQLLKPHAMAIVNADDTYLREWLEQCEIPSITYGLKYDATIEGEVIEETTHDQLMIVHAGCESSPVRLPRPGRHVASNALAAITAALSLGVDLPTIVRVIEQAPPSELLLEPLPLGMDFPKVVLDRGTLPDRLRTTLSTLKRTTAGKLWVLYEATGDLAKEHRAAMGTLIERYADHATLSVAPTLAHRALNILHDVLDGYEQPGRDCLSPQLEQAIEYVASRIDSRDTMLIVGDGNRVRDAITEALEQRRNEFEDQSPIKQFLPLSYDSLAVSDQSEPRILKLDDYRRRRSA